MRRKLTAFGLAAAVVAGGLWVAVLGSGTTQAAGSQATFIIPANNGYGVGDCEGAGSSCKVVADSWCEAQGFAHAESFGLADPADVTGAIPLAKADRSISITCAD